MGFSTPNSIDATVDVQSRKKFLDAVELRSVWKSYGSKKDAFSVLRGLSLKVPRGTIYGLLGPSGCGKTTLLRCIIGRESIDNGEINVLGDWPGLQVEGSKPRIGFMPQDIALNGMLSVTETMHFYGKIAGMKRREIEQSCSFLLKFLLIENTSDKFISQLSGGQQRRVSFAIALLHEPELLILDEPTVGVDPVLRQGIWDYLNILVNSKERPVTIIITTHYIEEAGQAHNVGLMLHGRLLAQSPPAILLRKYDCSTLEQVFLKLCLQNADDPDEGREGDFCGVPIKCNDQVKRRKLSNSNGGCGKNNSRVVAEETEINGNEGLGFYDEEQGAEDTQAFPDVKKHRKPRSFRFPRWYRVQAFFIKDLRFFLRHIGLFIFEILLPPAIIIVFSLNVGKPLFGLLVGIVNEDNQELGQNYLGSIDKSILTQVSYNSYSDAEEAALLGIVSGVVYLNPNFSISMRSRFQESAFTKNLALEQSTISISLDLTSQQTAYTINTELMLAFQKFARNTISGLGMNPMIGEIPLKYESRQVYGSLDLTFDQFLLPGFLLCITFFMAMGLTAVLVNNERLSGNLERVIVTSADPIEMIFGHMLAHLIVMMAQILCIFIVAFTFYGFNCEGSYILAALLAAAQGLCGMYYGFVLATAFDTETTMIMVALASWFAAIVSEGFLWPLEGMPVAMKYICQLLPQTYAIEAMRSILSRGWGILYTQVILGFSLTLTWVMVFLIAASVIARLKL